MRIAKWISILCGCLAPALIPPAHIAVLWYFWKNYSRYVDRRFCSCSCWDTVFKGPYESGIASYKHIYFNATQNTLKIWILIVVGILAFYESIKQLLFLLLKKQIRYSMVILFSLSIFSHYYSWWVCINYYNDDYYYQWNHQLFFSVSNLMILYLKIKLMKFVLKNEIF